MQRLRSRFVAGPLLESRKRGFCTSSEKIVALVLFERLRVVIPKPDPAVYTFQEFKFNWQQQFRRRYPDEFLDIAKNRSLYRALDKKLYLLVFGKPYGATSDKPIWHFPEKVYDSEPTLRKRFFFKCSVVAASKYDISNCEDYIWVTKDELLEIFPEQAEFFNKMIIS